MVLISQNLIVEAACFNEKPYVEPKKSYSAKYVGVVEASKPTGIDVLNKAISKATAKSGNGQTCLVEITVSNIKVIDCHTQDVVTEDRVRFISFIGVGKDERLCGYIVNDGNDIFICHVFLCTPNCASLTKALEEACRLRFQKCLDARPELAHKMLSLEHDRISAMESLGNSGKEKTPEETEADKEKGGFFQGIWGKFGQKKHQKKEEEVKTGTASTSSNSFLVKYYGALPVAIGTGADTIQEAAKHLAGGTLLICQMEVTASGITLYDSQRSPLSRRHIDADNLSYCGTTNDKINFGVIESQGGGKYICHVFAEYKTKIGPILALIQESM